MKKRKKKFAMITAGMLALDRVPYALAQMGGSSVPTGYFTASSTRTLELYSTNTVDQQVSEFSTDLIAKTAGGSVVFDQTFTVAYSDPTVQAAVTQAETDLAGAGDSSFTGPTLISSFDTLLGTAMGTNVTVAGSGTSIAYTDYTGPITVLVGQNQTVPITVPPTEFVLDALYTTTVTNDVTITVTSTSLLTQTYQLTGLEVPEPGDLELLGLGMAALAALWRRQRAGNQSGGGQ